ncbi:unnamed protein product [Moneuplotes crassus]|uniref:PH domain-containing protein n=1 Tax=Euplotes crassus TaxID=5936 RepID=A0AAD1XDA3_EUPCR|nr:unnamed protein product [Moneuplotes crassus]
MEKEDSKDIEEFSAYNLDEEEEFKIVKLEQENDTKFSINKRRSVGSCKQPTQPRKLGDSGEHGRPSIPRLTVKVKKPGDIKMKGHLSKYQPKALVFGKWKDRYCILQKTKFKYYKSKEDKKPLGIVDFDKVDTTVVLDDKDDKAFKITMRGQEKEIILKASSEEQAAKWVEKMEKMIKKSKGRKKELTMLQPKFWKEEYLDVDEFKELADNGDLLLFKSQTFGTKFQRVVTRSEYDHVGMIVLCETDKDVNTIFLLEAVCDDGVRLVEFLPNLDKYFDAYPKIVYRPLQGIERDEKLLTDLDDYLEEVLGKKYNISLTKLMRKTMAPRNTLGKFTEKEDRTFQCAELVAKMYKVLGILGPTSHSCQYMPVHFTDKRTITLNKGEFGPQCSILDPDIQL